MKVGDKTQGKKKQEKIFASRLEHPGGATSNSTSSKVPETKQKKYFPSFAHGKNVFILIIARPRIF